jgi:GH15 family glucan-1,4-alpha-glucosidase
LTVILFPQWKQVNRKMASPIEDYAMIGDCHTAGLIALNGSLDWLCLPRFDSGACFAGLLGTPEHGRWQICPRGEVVNTRRQYREGTLVLETEYDTSEGSVTIVDCMPPRHRHPHVVRTVMGNRGQVAMHMELTIRYDYGSIVPWVRRTETGIHAVAGPDALRLHTDVELRGKNLTTVADFTVSAGQTIPFVLAWHPSHQPATAAIDPLEAVKSTENWWRDWSGRCSYQGPWREAVLRSLITLKSLTYAPTGGIVAAPTTSLPEALGGVRNWDYRYCWVRDATFTLYALMMGGYLDEARAWREWLLCAVAGKSSELNIMYGLAGERRLTELELDWLPGYENSKPVRIGNAACQQFQLDVYGEVMDALLQAQKVGLETDKNTWRVQVGLADFLESAWQEPDEGIWEIRGPRQHFTHSKVMAWVAVDRMIQSSKLFKLDGPVERWNDLRTTIHNDVCSRGFDANRNTFTQVYGGSDLDASLLMIPLVGFLPGKDPRVRGTVGAIQRHLMTDGFVARYPSASGVDGLPVGEGAFLPCTFWLVDNLELLGRHDEAVALFERLLGLRNDVGLLSEEYNIQQRRLVGNFPQAFSHVALVNSAFNLSGTDGPARHRRDCSS